MRSEQGRRMGGRRHRSPQGGDERFGSERLEGQYEKDRWHPDPARRSAEEPPGRQAREGRGRPPGGPEGEEQPYQPFEPGHPREEGRRFGSGPPPRYLGTGYPGRGGPGFTGGYYGFGPGSLEPDWRAGRPYPAAGEGSLEADWRAQRRYPPGPKGYQRSDERLREDISERLMQARHIDSSDVTVEVSGAKVVLDGTVPERRMKHAIEDLADACPGVQDIENRIRVRR
ncbi:MAG TPA: BON domain-containing protein [Steroidobacteraceae bacterium]|nr:BON domain-containing protein [Steroidobacteraceae bacterium]